MYQTSDLKCLLHHIDKHMHTVLFIFDAIELSPLVLCTAQRKVEIYYLSAVDL